MTDAPMGSGVRCNCGLWHPEVGGPREDCPVHGRKESDEARARLAAVIAECDRIVADSNAEMVLNAGGVSIWPSWTARKTAQHLRTVALGDA